MPSGMTKMNQQRKGGKMRICKKCPNKEEFHVIEYGNCDYESTRTVDENGDTIDDCDTDYNNHDCGDETVTCNICGSLTEDVEESEWELWKGPVPQKGWK